MSIPVDFLTELNILETRINQVSTALLDASVRLAAIKERGPIITPNQCEWACYIQDLEIDLHDHLKMLSQFLDDIHWNGPEMPRRKDQWTNWWNNIRFELSDKI